LYMNLYGLADEEITLFKGMKTYLRLFRKAIFDI
jgi:hypothetical protein